jgi:hypothetical protein
VFLFSLRLLFETFLMIRTAERDIIIDVHRSSCKVSVNFCQILIKLEFSQQIVENPSSTKFHENTSSRNRAVPYERTHSGRDLTKLIIDFRNFSNARTISNLRLPQTNDILLLVSLT